MVLAVIVATGPNAIIVSPEWRRQLIERNGSAEGAVNECATARSFLLESVGQGDTSLDSTDKRHCTSECSDHRANGALGSVSAEEKDTVSGARPVSQIEDAPWWRDHLPGDVVTTLCSAGRSTKGEVTIRNMEVTGEPCEALLDSGASRSFINPVVVERLSLKSTCLPTAHCFTMANGEPISVDRVVYALTIVCNGRCLLGTI